MLVLCEVLSFADHEFVGTAQKQFFAFNKSMSGEINFEEFQSAFVRALPADEVPSIDQIKAYYNLIDKDRSDDITWSEW